MAKEGRQFVFHGAFGSKAAAVKKEREVDGFLRETVVRGDPRWLVLTRKNGNPGNGKKRGRIPKHLKGIL